MALLVMSLIAATCTSGSNGSQHRESSSPRSALAVVSEDPYSDPTTYHRTETEPDSFAFGSTIVSTFHVGKGRDCSATNLGWSVSTDAGSTWTDGLLPGTTAHATPPGPWERATDPVVAYDAKHETWLVQGLGRLPSCKPGRTVFVSRSTDGARTFGEPVVIKAPKGSQDFDKNWIACDNTPASPFYGHCYAQWDDEGNHLALHMSTSIDGGLTWIDTEVPRDTHVFGGQPLIQPDGTVIMPILACCEAGLAAFVSTDGGRSFTGPGINDARPGFGDLAQSQVLGGLTIGNEGQIISADIDAAGKVYVVWHDCRFRDGPDQACGPNDIVMSTTTDGRHWSQAFRIPIDARTSTVDHFLPAIGVDPTTSGSSAHLGVVYYFYPEANCDIDTCELSVGFASSTDGGVTWKSRRLAGPFRNTWLPATDDGYFVGDYVSVSFVDGKAIPVFTVASEGECELGRTSCQTWIASGTISLAETSN